MKKETKEVKEVVVETKPTITEMDHEFNRTDLNLLRDKLNELIRRTNG